MLKRRQEEIQFLIRTLDIFICIVAFFTAHFTRSNFDTKFFESIQSLSWMLGSSVVLHTVLYPYFGFYESLRLKSVHALVKMVVFSAVVEFFTLGSLVFLLQAKDTSRYFFGLFLLFNYSLIIIERIGAKILLGFFRQRGFNFRRILIIGKGKTAHQVIQAFKQHAHWGYVTVGILDDINSIQFHDNPNKQMSDKKVGAFMGIPILGTLTDLPFIIKKYTIDEVFVTSESFEKIAFERELPICEEMGIPVRFSFGNFGLNHSRISYSELAGLPVLTLYNTSIRTPIQSFLKRIIDILVSLAGLGVTALLYPWIAYCIRKQSPGPVIFKQIRIGQNGRTFKCYKFRTMCTDAESKKLELLSTSNQMEGPIFKLANDPRVFPFGAFLRRTSLDELPQFINILRGDMSAVGTRPPTPDEVERYKTHYRRRLSIRPGLTGLWQVSGRNEIKDFDGVLELDLKYIDNWSLFLDLRILAQTLFVVFQRKGAY